MDKFCKELGRFQKCAKKFLAQTSATAELALIRQFQVVSDEFKAAPWATDSGVRNSSYVLRCIACPFATRLLSVEGFPRVTASMASFLALLLK